jgi:hypothetical protein
MKFENTNIKNPFEKDVILSFKTVVKFHLNTLENYINVEKQL